MSAVRQRESLVGCVPRFAARAGRRPCGSPRPGQRPGGAGAARAVAAQRANRSPEQRRAVGPLGRYVVTRFLFHWALPRAGRTAAPFGAICSAVNWNKSRINPRSRTNSVLRSPAPASLEGQGRTFQNTFAAQAGLSPLPTSRVFLVCRSWPSTGRHGAKAAKGKKARGRLSHTRKGICRQRATCLPARKPLQTSGTVAIYMDYLGRVSACGE
jgi:hypothetical protein